VLFDFYDVECYDPNGAYYGDKAVSDSCAYDSDGNGSRDKNWAIDWQNTHTQNVDWYSCSSSHSQPLNANQKAYVIWWLWARLGGWDGEMVYDCPCLDATAMVDFYDYRIVADNWQTGSTGIAGDVTGDDFVDINDLNVISYYWLLECY